MRQLARSPPPEAPSRSPRHVARALRAALRVFLAQGRGGTIVSVGSITGQAGSPMQAAYGAAKAGLASLARSVAAEYSRDGIRMNVLSCGPDRDRRLPRRPNRRDGLDPDGPCGRVARGRGSGRVPRVAAVVVRRRQKASSSTAARPRSARFRPSGADARDQAGGGVSGSCAFAVVCRTSSSELDHGLTTVLLKSRSSSTGMPATWAIIRPRRTRRGSSTTGTAGSAGSPRASPPTPPGARAR